VLAIKKTEKRSVTIRQHPGQYAHLPRPLQPEKAMNKWYPASCFWCGMLQMGRASKGKNDIIACEPRKHPNVQCIQPMIPNAHHVKRFC
jgi:hypothetical protein